MGKFEGDKAPGYCCVVTKTAKEMFAKEIEAGTMTLEQATQIFVGKCEGVLNGGPCETVEGTLHAGEEHNCPNATTCASKLNNADRTHSGTTSGERTRPVIV